MKQSLRRKWLVAGFLFPLMGATVSVPAAERDAVVTFGGCTGFVVKGNLLVTAKHCRHPETITVTIEGKTVAARRAVVASGKDGPVIFRLTGGPYPSLPVARRKPEIGDAVYSLGYPGGNWARLEGKLIGGNGVDVNETNHRIASGNSGGPLLNSQGEVIGIALHVATDISLHRSGFAGWKVTTDAIRAAGQHQQGLPTDRNSPRPIPVIVVFSSPNCEPCQRLERDVRTGYFPGYEFQFVKWNEKSQTFSDGAAYREFWQSCRPQGRQLSFPTIWVKGTGEYRVGYAAEKRSGLLGWLARAVKQIVEGIFGRTDPPKLPIPENVTPDIRSPNRPPTDNGTKQLLDKLRIDIFSLRDEAQKTRSDFAQFQQSGVIGKIKAIARLKSDKDVALQRVNAVKSDVKKLRGDFRENPLQLLWGLLGIVTGLFHRRFAK